MKVLRIAGCLLLLLMQTIFVGCSKEEIASRDKHMHPVTHPLTITSCGAANVDVRDKDSVVWNADADYQITFVPTVTPSGPAVPTTPASFPVLGGTSVPHLIQGPSNCSAAGCLYKYSLTRLKNGVPEEKPCADPGIRILPGP
jgi:hypothetical protein